MSIYQLKNLANQLKKCRYEFLKGNNPLTPWDENVWSAYLLDKYGIKLVKDLTGMIVNIQVVDSKKYIFFQLKYS